MTGHIGETPTGRPDMRCTVSAIGKGVVGSMLCRFAVGQNGLAYSGVWRVWTAKNQPDLYLAVRNIAGEMKASVHGPRPPHTGWERKYSFTMEASGELAKAVKQDSGPHQVRWPGCPITPDCTLEFRIIFRGISLDKNGLAVQPDTALLPIPSEYEFLEVAVLLGSPNAPVNEYPRFGGNTPTRLLSEGRLSNGYRVWVVYYTTQMNREHSPQQHLITPDKFYTDPTIDLTKVSSLRAGVFGVEDRHLVFWDMSAKYTARAS
jgi:hypothetical protein